MNRADIDLVVLEHETVLAFEGIQQVGQERLIPPMIATMSARRVEDPGVQRRVAPGGDEAAHDGVVAVEADDAADTARLLPILLGDIHQIQRAWVTPPPDRRPAHQRQHTITRNGRERLLERAMNDRGRVEP